MPRPQDSVTRERKSLNGLWAFCLDPEGSGRDAGWFRSELSGARAMPVPASFNDVVADPSVRNYVGDLWYQTRVRVPHGGRVNASSCTSSPQPTGRRSGSTTSKSLSHEGGYTPFEADITEHATAGEQLRVTAVVNNTLSFQSIPPGVIEDTVAGKRQRYFHDFFNYAGIHRNVWLCATPTSYVEDVTVVTGLDGTTGTVT
jgi:beta-glucuronidase